MKNLTLLTTLLLGLAAHGQPSDPITTPPLLTSDAPASAAEGRRYRHGDPIPEGYRVISEPSWGLVSAGIAVFAVSYVPFAVIGTQLGAPLNAIPFIGPIMAFRPSRVQYVGIFFDAISVVAIGIDVAVQLGGAVMLVAGLGVRNSRLERAPTRPGISFVPAAPGATLGGSVAGRF